MTESAVHSGNNVPVLLPINSICLYPINEHSRTQEPNLLLKQGAQLAILES